MSTAAIKTGPLTPSEISFIAENEPITIVTRQRLEGLNLISGYISAFRPPQRATIPLWLALVLKSQKRCNIVPPPWLNSVNIATILAWETENPAAFSSALPYRWLETAELLLSAAPDDIADEDVRVLLRDLREVRQRKARDGLKQLEATYLQMNGLGLLEITELRGFAAGVVDGLRKLGSTREETRRIEEEEEAHGRSYDDDFNNLQTSNLRAMSMSKGSTVRGATIDAVRQGSSLRFTQDDGL